jgi:AcrR family transcriptional regulator
MVGVRAEAGEAADPALARWEHRDPYGSVWKRPWRRPLAHAQTPRSSWIDAGLEALATGGPDAVRIEPLAQALGVTKGGFYWQFDNRGALLEELLDRWEQTLVDEVIERVEADGGDARSRLQRLFALAGAGEVRGLLRAELAIRDWARRDDSVGARLRRVDNRRMVYMRGLFSVFCPDPDEVEARCLVAMALFVGSHFVAVDHGTRSRREVVDRALEQLLV